MPVAYEVIDNTNGDHCNPKYPVRGKPARIIRGKAAIELKPLRNEGKAVVPLRCKWATCHEVSSEKVKHRAERGGKNETFAPVPSFLQGHTSINGVSSGFLVA